MTDPRPTDDWLAAEADLQDRLARLDAAARDLGAALERRADEAAAPLRALVADAADAHRRLMAEHGLDRPPGDRPAADAWRTLAAYRRDAAAVHARLVQGLRDLDLGAAVGQAFAEAAASLPALADGVPERVVRPEPAGLLDAEAGDRPGLLARKAAERTKRRLEAVRRGLANGARAVVRKPPRAPAPRAQAVPLRALVAEHAATRLARFTADFHERTQHALGRSVAEFEIALAAWADAVLQAESALDRPGFHADLPPADVQGSEEVADNPDPEDAPDTDVLERASAAAHALDAALRAADFAAPAPDAEALKDAHDALRERVRRSGYDSDPAPDADAAETLAADAERWASWHRDVGARLFVDALLLDLRDVVSAGLDRFVAAVEGAVLAPVRRATQETAAHVERLRADAAALFDQEADPDALADALRLLLADAEARVEDGLLGALQPISLDRAVEAAAAAFRQRLADAVRAVPERLRLRARLAPERAGQPAPTADVGLRDVVRTSLSDAFAGRLAKTAAPLRQPLFRALSGAEGVRDVVRYNLESALDELDGEGEDAVANARELTMDGLARSTEQLGTIAEPLAEPWAEFVQGATERVEQAWAALHQRANAENLVAAQFLDARARAVRAVERAKAGLRAFGERSEQALRSFLRLGRREAKRLVQMGQAAAGLAGQSVAARQRTLDALADAPRLHAALPLVYRRLFSFAPTADPGLLVGRRDALQRVAEQFERWEDGRDASALIVTATAGGGRTSFVLAARASVFDGADIRTVTLTERVPTEAALARLLADALGLADTLDTHDPRPLDALEAALLADAGRRVCVVERLEHLFLRTIGGFDLLERTLVFMSRTDKRVFWLGTMVESGWQFVERTAPQLTGLADAVALPPLTREETEEALMRRHQRSGLPLRFAPPPDPPPLLARRLGKAKSEEERQAVLRAEFFDGLYRASGPFPLLALLYWLRAADFEAEADTLTLQPVRPLDFAFLSQFDLPRLFVLRALLQHGSLTLGEHARIFRTEPAESRLLLESLYNLRLLQPLDDGDGAAEGAAPEPLTGAARYRLHPLAVAPVMEALRTKNIL